MAELDVLPVMGPRTRVPVVARHTLIGRATESDVFLADTMLSRRHAEIEQRADGHYLLDLGSTNGTFLNGERVVGERRLRDGDLITMGDSRIRFTETVSTSSAQENPLEETQAFALNYLRSRTTSQTMSQQDPDRQTRLLHLVSKATASLLGHRPLNELFERVLDVVFASIPIERAAIMLIDKDGQRAIRASRAPETLPLTKISETISQQVLEQRVAVLCPNVLEDPNLSYKDSVVMPGIRSAMCAPLWLSPGQGAPEEVIGLLYADTTAERQRFGENDLEILTAFGNIAASKIESTRLLMDSLERDHLAGEIEAAASIQRNILPTKAPEIPRCELTGESRSCEGVGGDYHDYEWDGNRLLLTLADVSGKGLGAAMLMTALRAAVRAHWRESSLSEAAARINRTFFENVPSDRYATCFLARLDPSTGQLDYLNAGHPPALLVRADGTVERLESGGPGLALFDTGDFGSNSTNLATGDILLVYSDGISESWPDSDEAEAVLASVVRSAKGRPLDQLRSEIFAAADLRRGRERGDDCTLILLRRGERLDRVTPVTSRQARVWQSSEG
jgi:sigma-B regulation protein RsbU (phosphoserine phosphatase)